MDKILIFAGTTEGRKLSEYLMAREISHTVCVATEYGEIVMPDNPKVTIHQGRMNQAQIREFSTENNFKIVVDATHPYADVVTSNIKKALEGTDIRYIRLKRDSDADQVLQDIFFFDSNEKCAKALESVEGNILLTTGSKELAKYCINEKVKEKLYVRVLPSVESINLCYEQGIKGKQIIAMQGPFNMEMNKALINQYKITCMVTKESGNTGGYSEKVNAARELGVAVYVVGRPSDDEGYSFGQACDAIESFIGKRSQKNIQENTQLEIILAGIGMGNRQNLTREVYDAIENADILLGAPRMLEPYHPRIEKRPYYMASYIIPYLYEVMEKNSFLEKRKIVVLFSGDTGFYSGCKMLYNAIAEEIGAGKLDADIKVLPGISSVAYLASCINETYHDACIYSMHGKKVYNLAQKIKVSPKTYLLMSGLDDVHKLAKCLIEADLSECETVLGYQLSYADEKIMRLTPKECLELDRQGLYICFIKNTNAISRSLTHGKADDSFIRDKVPMTKEEVREVSICKLRLRENAIVYDIGSGTGSIAVEIAGLSDSIEVYAIEQKHEAIELIERNIDKFKLENIRVIEAKAPDGFDELKVPTHAFIGGSSGNMKSILSALYKLNPHIRVVINAISMETISEITGVLSEYDIVREDVVQIQVNKAKKVGKYHLMQAENPVWICSFEFAGE